MHNLRFFVRAVPGFSPVSDAEPERRRPRKSGEMPTAVLFLEQSPQTGHHPATSRETQQAADGQKPAKVILLACSRSFPGFEVTHFPFLLCMEEFVAFFFFFNHSF